MLYITGSATQLVVLENDWGGGLEGQSCSALNC